MFSSSLLAAALALLPSAHAFFILNHHGSLVVDRLDPIVNAGTVSGHVHNVVGSTGFGPEVTFQQLRNAKCTTSPAQVDKSIYWTPSLFYKNDDGTFSNIPIGFVNTYYYARGGPNTPDNTVKAFPDGLRMLAGTPYPTGTYDASSHAEQAVSYVCLNYKGKSVGPTPHFPNSQCPDGLRMQVMFPSCWDGVNLDSADHKSHMAYPVQNFDSGDCPKTHPVKVTTLFYEFSANVANFPGFGPDRWVFASGSGDRGFHGDFMNGWDHGVLQAAMDKCTANLFGDLASCPPLVPTLDKDTASKCTLAPVVEESTGLTSKLAKLPGCNPVPSLGAAAKCPGIAIPAIKGFSPAQAGSSASSSPVSVASTASSSAVSVTRSSAAASSSSSAAASVTRSAVPTAPASSSVPASSTRSINIGASHSIHEIPSPSASVSRPGPGAIKSTQPSPTAAPHTCKRSNRDGAALAVAAAKKRAVQHHARRSVNRISF